MRLATLLIFIVVLDLAAARGDTNKSGTLGTETWTAAQGPYRVTATVTVPSGATLTIEPGTQVYISGAQNFIIASGGRLLAEGTAAQPIRFSRVPAGATWGNVRIDGAAGSPETRMAYLQVEGNGGSPAILCTGATVSLDHLTFANRDVSYVHVDGSSFIISNCVFPQASPGKEFEGVHGTGGIKAGGYGIIRGCYFGKMNGYNDVVDFTGGNRPGPIIQFINNVFVGTDDDILDLDGTDAWVEANIFLHAHRNGSPDSSSAVSGGSDQGNTSKVSRITIIGNLLFDVDQAATAKQGNFYVLLNNTVVHQTHTGSKDTFTALVNVFDNEAGGPAAGIYLEGNIVVDAEALVRNYDPATSLVTYKDNILPLPWSGPGSGNVIIDPQLRHVPSLAETYFPDFQSAQILRDWLSLRPGSLALGTGPNGLDKGGAIPFGVSISGVPQGTTAATDATLVIGVNRTGSGIPVAGFPNGSGFTHYKWKLDGGAYSAETAINTPIVLSGLANGVHTLSVDGKNDAGFYQDDPRAFGPNALPTTVSWTVNTALVGDSDSDGLPDAWESTYAFNLMDPSDADADVDGDGRSNRAEYLAGTNPRDPGSNLHLLLTAPGGGQAHVLFAAQPNKTYTVEYTPTLTSPTWLKLADVPAQATGHIADFGDPIAPNAQRFYRVVTPATSGAAPRALDQGATPRKLRRIPGHH